MQRILFIKFVSKSLMELVAASFFEVLLRRRKMIATFSILKDDCHVFFRGQLKEMMVVVVLTQFLKKALDLALQFASFMVNCSVNFWLLLWKTEKGE